MIPSTFRRAVASVSASVIGLGLACLGAPLAPAGAAPTPALVVDVTYNGTLDTQTHSPSSFANLTVKVTNSTGMALTNLQAASGDAGSPAAPATWCPKSLASLAVDAVWTFTCTTTRADYSGMEYVSVWADSADGVWRGSDNTEVIRLRWPEATLEFSASDGTDSQQVAAGAQPVYKVHFVMPPGTMRPWDNLWLSSPLAPDCDRHFTSIPGSTVYDYTCTGPVNRHDFKIGIDATFDVGSSRTRMSDLTAVVVPPPTVSVGDYVWLDHNRDGLQGDPQAEPPVEGVKVHLLDSGGNEVATHTTDQAGFYSFAGLTPSTDYSLVFDKPAGLQWTVQNAGQDDAVDSDVDPGTGKVNFTSPESGDGSAATPDLPTLDGGLYAYNLTLAKTLTSSHTVQVGDTVTFRLSPTNEGPSDALAGWSVTEVLPKGMKLVSMKGNGYSCADVTCTAANGLAAGKSGAPITVKAKVTKAVAGKLHNVAYVSPADNDGVEKNPLVVPHSSTNTSATDTDNDAQASVKVREVSPTHGHHNNHGVLPDTGAPRFGPVEGGVAGMVLLLLGTALIWQARRRRLG